MTTYARCGPRSLSALLGALVTLLWCVSAAPASAVEPDTIINSGPTAPTNAGFVLDVSATGVPDADYECRYNSAGAWAACDYYDPEGPPITRTNVTVPLGVLGNPLWGIDGDVWTDSQHTVAVRAVDAATGDVDPTPATWDVHVDLVPPTGTSMTSDTLEAGPWVRKNTNRDGAAIGATRAACERDPASCAREADDPTRNNVGARDLGYVYAYSDMPTEVTIRLGATDPTTRWTCSLDGGDTQPCVDGQTYTGLSPDRGHSITAEAIDNVGPYCRNDWTINRTIYGGGPCDPIAVLAGQQPGNGRAKSLSWRSVSPLITRIATGPGRGGATATNDTTPTWTLTTDTSQASPTVQPLTYECAIVLNVFPDSDPSDRTIDRAGWHACDPAAANIGPDSLPVGTHMLFVRTITADEGLYIYDSRGEDRVRFAITSAGPPTPTDPPTPVDPPTPTDPPAPVDPPAPTDPPSTPDVPTTPTTPTVPTTPTTPTTPTVPTTPTTPKKLGPEAVARATRTKGTDAGFRIDGSRSRDRDGGRIVSYRWVDRATGKTVSRSKAFPFTATKLGAKAKAYRWRLTVTDDDGLSDSADVTVNASKQVKRTVVRFSGDALFYFDRATLRPDGLKQLAKIRKGVRGAQSYSVSAHASSEGSVPYNQALSQRRAAAMVRYIQRGNPRAPKRHSARGYGETRPVASNRTEAGRKLNRRAEVTIVREVVRYDVDVDASVGKPKR